MMIVVVALCVAALPVRPRARREQTEAPTATARVDALAISWRTRRDNRRSPSPRTVATWCDDIARRVRSGSSLRDAVTAVPTDAALQRSTIPVLLAIERGAALADAVARVDDADTHLRLALGVIATASRIGGPSAASIDRTAALLRQRAADLEERSTQAAQARLSTHVMTAVPLVMLAALLATDADVRSAATAPAGIACIGAGILLNAIGWWWMHRIVRTST